VIVSAETLANSAEETWTRLADLTPRLALALVVLVVGFLLARVAGRMVDALLARGELTQIQRGFFRLVAVRLAQLATLAVILDVLGFRGVATWLAASGGIVAVILGFAFRQIGENFIAGVFLAYRSPFRVGDLIRSGSLEGVVRSIDLRATHIRTAEGMDIFIPNSKILNEPVVNFTLDGNLRAEFDLRGQ
jgi:small conductance mechanosensitive channel